MRPLKRTSNGDDPTGSYYERNAQTYFYATRDVDMSDLYREFIPLVRPGGRILDVGSGSGRDTLAFLRQGYKVDAFDSSPRLAALSTKFSGVPTRILRLQEFDSGPVYDGIWACASLLHVPKEELDDALGRLIHALNPAGVLYLSVKHGAGERFVDDGRYFADLDRNAIEGLFEGVPEMQVVKVWLSAGEGARRGKDEWINALAVKHQSGRRP
jgi:SAM-dependent methyltransferase